MDPNDLQLAISYAELAQSLAFNDFMQFQRLECERLELIALEIPATNFEACRSAIIAWQQRRLVIQKLEETVQRCANDMSNRNGEQ